MLHTTDSELLTFDQPYSRGNATDLSLLTHMTVEDIGRLQSVGREAQESRKQFILHDDQVRTFRLSPHYHLKLLS